MKVHCIAEHMYSVIYKNLAQPQILHKWTQLILILPVPTLVVKIGGATLDFGSLGGYVSIDQCSTKVADYNIRITGTHHHSMCSIIIHHFHDSPPIWCVLCATSWLTSKMASMLRSLVVRICELLTGSGCTASWSYGCRDVIIGNTQACAFSWCCVTDHSTPTYYRYTAEIQVSHRYVIAYSKYNTCS